MHTYSMILLIWNILVMLFYGLDKLLAQQGARRIRERTLLASAYLLGGVGAMFGMILFHHKTAKMKFRLLVPLAVVLNVAAVVLLRCGLFYELSLPV